MAQNRYIKDYRLVETVDERGRIRTDYEYIAEPWYYENGPEWPRRAKKTALLLCAAGWLAFLGALLPNSRGMHTLFVSMPFVFAALPLGLLTETLISAVPKAEPFEHRQADKLTNRYPVVSLAAAALPLISLLGELINLLRGYVLNGGDILFSLCAAILSACGFAAFSLRGRFAVRRG